MPPDQTPAALEHADARYLINQWSAQGFFRVRGLGGKISVEEVVPCASYTIQLKSQYEDRSVSEQTVPFTGGPLDDHGHRPDPWSMPVSAPTDFQDRTEAIPLPHTEHVRTCPACAGKTRVTCSGCGGFGKVNCPHCNGSGFRTRTETRTTHNAQGMPVTETVNVREACTCFHGKVPCGSCGGAGTVVCGQCQGHGRIKTFEQLDVHFRVENQTEAVHETRMPDALLKQTHGKVLCDERGTPTVPPPTLDGAVDGRVAQLLERAKAAGHSHSRLLFQHLHIEHVPIQEVRYRYRKSPPRCLWIYGDDQRIHAPGAPQPWGKLAAIILGGLLAVAAVIALLVGLL
jgi:hypothetical protein